MVFSSLSFLFCFFPAFLLVYYLTPSRPAGARNAVLLVGSCVFYIIGLDGQWAYFALLAASVLVNYGLGLAITRDKPRAKLWLIVGLCYNFLWLFLFKYLNFLLTGVNGVLGWVSGGKAAVPLLGWALPVGISFYTFSAGGYLIDVYRGTVAPERSLLTFGTYLTMFPKLVSGPIASYAQLQPEFGTRDVSLRQTVDGLKLFVFGMAFKILLANQLGGLWSDVTTIGFESLSTPLAWMAAFAYSFQLYFDFWGYSLMAIGIGRMLGFHLPENFRCPYLALSMTEFWRRWHITLGAWFRNYLYFPLGGSRCSRGRMIFNLLVVWLATGLWHGAHLNFLLWGLGLFGILTVEKLWLKNTSTAGRCSGICTCSCSSRCRGRCFPCRISGSSARTSAACCRCFRTRRRLTRSIFSSTARPTGCSSCLASCARRRCRLICTAGSRARGSGRSFWPCCSGCACSA